jgi:hypothetical protein
LQRSHRATVLARMKSIEFELDRTIRAPIDQVFARLADIDGHNDWMAGTGSMLRRTRQTSPGEPTVGTTFVDETSQGWPSYDLQSLGDGETLVRHRAKLAAYGVWGLGTPILRRFAVKERTITVDALKTSFERDSRSA